MPSSVELMKHLLSTGEHSDVHFLVGDGDAKEVLLAHQLILKSASDVFEAMFRFDAKKERPENAPANCPADVEIPDIEPSAFKLMLSFIYTNDLSELNGDNAMAVLYAAKKYNIPDLADASLQIPIPELGNVFFAYAQALLFELEDFSIKCFRYICQNAAKLFGSEDFLQIDQKMLCNLLDRDRLLISDEFEIWKAALRWADEKCRQNGIECSSKNRRLALGPALFKIRFPNIHEENFVKFVVPSSMLTMEELLGIYQFNSHPYNLRGIPGLYSLKFPSHGRIFDWNIAKDNRRGTLALQIEKVSEFAGESVWSRRLSDAVEIKGLALKIRALIREKREGSDEKKCLAFYLWCDQKEGGPRHSVFSATFRIVSEKIKVENSIGRLYHNVIDPVYQYGFGNFITFLELMDPRNGFYDREEDKVILAIDVILKDEQMERFISDPNKSNGTIEMEIEKVSDFAREIIGSERKSEAVHIKGMPWKIRAEVEKKNDNEKWLGFYLLCAAPKKDKNWSCECSSTFRIVSQKSGVKDSKRELSEKRTCKNQTTNRGFSYFISFVELMDPSKGFYDKSEDKVTLAIDVSVK